MKNPELIHNKKKLQQIKNRGPQAVKEHPQNPTVHVILNSERSNAFFLRLGTRKGFPLLLELKYYRKLLASECNETRGRGNGIQIEK